MKWPWSKPKTVAVVEAEVPAEPAKWWNSNGEVVPNCAKTAGGGTFWCGLYEGHHGPHGHPMGNTGAVLAPWGNNDTPDPDSAK